MSSRQPAYRAALASWICAHVVLRDHQARRRPRAGRRRTCGRPARSAAIAPPSAPSITPSVVTMPAEVHLGDRLDDPRAADARDRVRGVEPRLVRPRFRADHLEARLERLRSMRTRSIAPGAARCPPRDLRALEGRAGRARAGQQAVAVAEHDLRVRADVDEQRSCRRWSGRLGQDHARGVGADVARDARQDVYPRVGFDVQVELGRRASPPRRWPARRARRRARRIDAEQQVMHDRVADDRELEDVVRVDARPPAELRRRARRRTRGPRGHLRLPAGVHHHGATRGSSGPRRSGSAGSSRRPLASIAGPRSHRCPATW